jgi:hypothetical protein
MTSRRDTCSRDRSRSRVVLGQVAADGQSNEIIPFASLMDTLIGLDLAAVVVTADAITDLHPHQARQLLGII